MFCIFPSYQLVNFGISDPNMNWHWRANTLNPFYEGNDPDIMIDDAILIKDTLANWYFGADDTGDITTKGNILGLAELMKTKKAHLVNMNFEYDSGLRLS